LKIFLNLKSKTYFCCSTIVLSRCEEAWACCLTPLEDVDTPIKHSYPLSLMNQFLLSAPSSTPINSTPIPGSPLTDIDIEDDDEDSFSGHNTALNLVFDIKEEDIIIIDTLFDPEDPANKQPPFHECDPLFILEWTRKERKKAEMAVVIENVDDLKYRVRLFFNGIKYRTEFFFSAV
jgi:hypothetical protein